MYLDVKKGNNMVNILLLKYSSRIIVTYKSSCVSALQIFRVLSDSDTAPDLCQNCDFFLKKRMKEIFAYVLEFMLTFDKMENASPLMCTKFEI